MTSILVRSRDFNGPPLMINGVPFAVPRNVAFDATLPVLEVLDHAQIRYTVLPESDPLAGNIIISTSGGYGGRVAVNLNGVRTFLPVGVEFTPAAGAKEVLDNAGIAYSYGGARATPPSKYAGVYAPGALAAAETWFGERFGTTVSYLNVASWATMVANSGLTVGSGRIPVVGAPIATGATLALAAVGTYDTYWEQCAVNMLAANDKSPFIVIRPLWEFNLPIWDWYGPGHEADYIATFRRIAGIFHAASPRFLISWCPNHTYDYLGSPYDVSLCWPGDAYVDICSMDVYMNSVYDLAGANTETTAWTYKRDASYGIQWLVDWAATHSKRWAIDEWGVDSDVTTYIALKAEYLRDNGCLYANYWNSNSAFQGKLSDNQYPAAAAKFILEFGRPAITSAAAFSVPAGAGVTWGLKASTPVTWSIIGGAHGSEFSVSGGVLTIPDSATGTKFVKVRATDTLGKTTDQDITVTITAAATLWTPSSLGSKAIRIFKAPDVALADGAAISNWDSRDTNDRDLTQATGSLQPTYRPTGRNGKPSVHFDGSDDYLSTVSTGLPITTAASSVFAVGYGQSTATQARSLFCWGSNTTGTLRSLGVSSAGLIIGSTSGTGNSHTASESWRQFDRMVAWTLDGATLASKLFVDGGAEQAFSLASVNTPSAAGRAGSRVDGANFWSGEVQALVIVNAVLTTNERQFLEGWAAWEFGLVPSLPSDHPYKSAPPTV